MQIFPHSLPPLGAFHKAPRLEQRGRAESHSTRQLGDAWILEFQPNNPNTPTDSPHQTGNHSCPEPDARRSRQNQITGVLPAATAPLASSPPRAPEPLPGAKPGSWEQPAELTGPGTNRFALNRHPGQNKQPTPR